ncbi:MAG: phenylacetic acid degradation operon negative regulatory protein PaaX [Hyphomicrobiaceae bacterium]|nr:phenylacetic acid degradation operon negative regulatory protein PaaX [Hyphomicrobiaceae bacterium]
MEPERPLCRAVETVLAGAGQPTAWSVIMTVFGDAAVPRGGSLWTGSLIEITALLGFNGGVVRTALSRLVADGWLESSRDGRRSYHRLTGHGLEATEAAARRIYRAGAPAWDGTWEVAISMAGSPAGKAELRRRLTMSGFGMISGETFLRPVTVDAPNFDKAELFLVHGAGRDGGTEPQLAARAWDLDAVAQSHARLEQRLEPLFRASLVAGRVGPADALAARILLIHEFRRVVLRDPDLPAELLPASWPGFRVRRSVAATYKRLLGASEDWLSQHAKSRSGPLPPAGRALGQRFAPGRAG